MTERAPVRDYGGTATMADALSVLDLVAVGEGHTTREALRTSARLARLAEARGFQRYWVAEHHSMPGIASSSPAVILAYLAAQTTRIRLGSGGVMLPNHAPLVVAEQFHTLEAMAPGRVDLGLGRAPGTDQSTARALRRTHGPATGDTFPADVAELLGFLDDDFPDGHPYRRVHAVPGPVQGPSGGRPAVWLLGSSGFSAQLAGRLGLPFAFAHHFAGHHTVPALELYRQSFRPSPVLAEPYTVVGVFAFAAETEEQARDQALTGALTTVRFRSGRPGLVPTPEEARSHVFTAYERKILGGWLEHAVHGTPDVVRERLDELRKRTQADELMLASNAHGLQERLTSLSLIADSYGM
ncbi:LLM class flavin-dependent oxidoreductase [Streptomyces tricolor]|uniref:LLM class flavin-dependent oxidoreductase n=2 Tax=Streptomyces TaxID=1883 RepID=A0ABS9JJM0_9ACTN|nr:LLM class flavin-dependent oxidoreductase [Streptomyces tricolor]MCG0065731.1 LLM class flavin-dependent oxidoreductase [Streptomyces tricolor]MYU31058.1 MsnO8 family LLM class oxidoreductase [Streptomyces sp. SID7810]